MTLLAIAQQMAVNIGEEPPVSTTDDTPFCRLAVQFINETGREIIRRVDWHSLRSGFTVIGDGTNRSYVLADDYDRLTRGLAATFNGTALRGSLSQDEWAALVHAQGVPRYFYVAGKSISFYPYLEDDASVVLSYQTKNWATDAGGNGKASLEANTDVERLSPDLLLRGAVWRWHRHAGRDYSDHMAEYEAMLADYAGAEGGVRQP